MLFQTKPLIFKHLCCCYQQHLDDCCELFNGVIMYLFLLNRNLLSPQEIDHLRTALEHPAGVLSQQYGVDDGQGKAVTMALWSHPGSDVTGMVARCQKVAGTFEKVLLIFMATLTFITQILRMFMINLSSLMLLLRLNKIILLKMTISASKITLQLS